MGIKSIGKISFNLGEIPYFQYGNNSTSYLKKGSWILKVFCFVYKGQQIQLSTDHFLSVFPLKLFKSLIMWSFQFEEVAVSLNAYSAIKQAADNLCAW